MPRQLLILLMLLTTLGCGRPSPETVVPRTADQPPPATNAVQPLQQRGEIRLVDRVQSPVIQVELAMTEPERSRGLMFRQTLPENAGMLFFMPDDDDHAFWMRNTYVRLDMVFIDSNWRVVGVLENVPPLNDEHRAVGQRSRYILELAAHVASRLGIHAGTLVDFRQVTPRPSP